MVNITKSTCELTIEEREHLMRDRESLDFVETYY